MFQICYQETRNFSNFEINVNGETVTYNGTFRMNKNGTSEVFSIFIDENSNSLTVSKFGSGALLNYQFLQPNYARNLKYFTFDGVANWIIDQDFWADYIFILKNVNRYMYYLIRINKYFKFLGDQTSAKI